MSKKRIILLSLIALASQSFTQLPIMASSSEKKDLFEEKVDNQSKSLKRHNKKNRRCCKHCRRFKTWLLYTKHKQNSSTDTSNIPVDTNSTEPFDN